MFSKDDYENPKPSRIRSAKAAKRRQRHTRKIVSERSWHMADRTYLKRPRTRITV